MLATSRLEIFGLANVSRLVIAQKCIDKKCVRSWRRQAGIFFRLPIIGELKQWCLVFIRYGIAPRFQKDVRIFTLLVVAAGKFHEPQFVAIKLKRLVEILYADHGVKIMHIHIVTNMTDNVAPFKI